MSTVASSDARPATSRKLGRGLLALSISLAVGLGLCEIVVRSLGHIDQDGNFLLRSRRIRPYSPPVASVEKQVASYLSADSFVAYDPDLGWAPRPNAVSRNGLYHYNSVGLRVAEGSREYPLRPDPDVLRIAIFGDSFTHGDDVAYDSAWGTLLEELLRARGKRVEVLNFGVFAYGMDQAYQRWLKVGITFHPQVVILGFQAENVKRNVNILRPLLWWGAEFPFSKPRFAIEGDRLRLLNVPAVEPQRVPEVLAHLQTWSLRDHEAFFHPRDYQPRFWSSSRFASLVVDVISDRASRGREDAEFYSLQGEPGQVTLRIVKEFATSVIATGAKFLIVHLPTRETLAAMAQGQSLPYAELLQTIGREHTLLETTDAMLQKAGAGQLDALFVSAENGHYSRAGNGVVADVVSRALAGQ